jgi:hypothetical protein
MMFSFPAEVTAAMTKCQRRAYGSRSGAAAAAVAVAAAAAAVAALSATAKLSK